MANKKISELTAKLAQLEDSDLVMVSEFNGETYDTKSVTGIRVRPFKTVMFNISQTGTSAPTVNYSYTDEVTQTFTFSRSSTGGYTLTASSPLFTTNKTFINITAGGLAGASNMGAYVTSTTIITFYTTDSTDGSALDELLDNASLEIKIIK